MAAREIIIYLRVTDSESFLVDSSNNQLLAPKHPIIYFTEKPKIKIRPLKADGTAYTLSEFSGYASFDFGIDNDWDVNSIPVVFEQSSSTTFTVEEVIDGDNTYVEINFLADANTTEFQTDIGVVKELRTGVYGELSAFNAGITEPQLILQFPFVMRNKLVDVTGGTPTAPTDNYYTKSQADATFENLVKDTAVTIIDDQANNIVMGDATLYRRIDFAGTLDDGTDYNGITGYIVHDGTNAEAFIDQDDFNATMFETLTCTADILTGSIRLIITASSVGSNLTFTYGINNYISV